MNGEGIQYDSAGRVLVSGLWSNGVSVQQFALDANRFPFSGQTVGAGGSLAN